MLTLVEMIIITITSIEMGKEMKNKKYLTLLIVWTILLFNGGCFNGLTDVAKKATGVLVNAGGEVKGNKAQGYTTAELEDFCGRQGVNPATVQEGDVRVVFKFNKALAKNLRELEWTEQGKERQKKCREEIVRKKAEAEAEAERARQAEIARKKAEAEAEAEKARQAEKKKNDETIERELPGIISKYEEMASSVAECINTNLYPYVQFIHFLQSDSNKKSIINRVDCCEDMIMRCDAIIDEYYRLMREAEKQAIMFYSYETDDWYNSDHPSYIRVEEKIFSISTNKIIKSNVNSLFERYKERLVGRLLINCETRGDVLDNWYKDKVVRLKMAIEKAKKNVEVIQQEEAQKIRLSKEYITMPEKEKFPLLSVQSKPLDFMKDIKSGVAAKWLEGYLLANKIEYKTNNDSSLIRAFYPGRQVDFHFYANALHTVEISLTQSVTGDAFVEKYRNAMGAAAKVKKSIGEVERDAEIDLIGALRYSETEKSDRTVFFGRNITVSVSSDRMVATASYRAIGKAELSDSVVIMLLDSSVSPTKKYDAILLDIKKQITKDKDYADLDGSNKIDKITLMDKRLYDYRVQKEKEIADEKERKKKEAEKAKNAAALDF